MAESDAHADRNLLFGVLALQKGFVARDQLVDAMTDWSAEKQTPLAQILRRRGLVTDLTVAFVDALVAKELGEGAGPVFNNCSTEDLKPVPGLEKPSTEMPLTELADQTMVAEPGGPAASFLRTLGADESGRYTVLRPHSAGAMGEVLIAMDTELNREVALKQIRDRFSNSPQQRARFVLEAEITGGLEHPGVVPVYSLGNYKDGRPFYVMRLIRGGSLKDAIIDFHRKPDYTSLGFRSLLRRFIDVCNAVAYAHSRGVLHRDLKPGNIMLGKFGETLVVDWGLAKPLGKPALPDPDAPDPLLPPSSNGTCFEKTRQGFAVGTPAYMSPEQAEGKLEALGPAADIYSLGATLYTLLAGKPPFLKKEIVDTLEEVRNGKFPPPRSVLSAIPPPLDAVCMKAMALDMGERYKSALDLAGDIERWLADEPLAAHRETHWETMRRWMRKNPRQVTAIAATILVGLTSLAANLSIVSDKNRLLEKQAMELATTNQELKAANDEQAAARKHAQQKEREARALVDDWFTAVSESKELKQTPNTQSLRKNLLGRAKEYYEKAVVENAGDGATLKATAAAYFRLAYLTDEIAPGPEALAAYEKALTIRERLFRDNPQTAEHAMELAKTHANIGKLLRATGKTQEAQAAMRKSLGLLENLTKEHPQAPEYANELARLQINFSALLYSTGKSAEALAATERALAIRERLQRENPNVAEYASDLADTFGQIGNLMYAARNPTKAIEAYQKAQPIYERLAKENPAATDYAIALAAAYGNIGILQFETGKTEHALAAYQNALAVYGRLARENPTVPRFANLLADTQNNLGGLFQMTGNVSEALRSFEQAQAVYERLVRDNPAVTEFKVGLGGSYCNLGSLIAQLGRSDEALATLTKAIDVLEGILKNAVGHPQAKAFLSNAYLGRARTCGVLKRMDEARADFDRAATLTDDRHAEAIRKERDALLAKKAVNSP